MIYKITFHISALYILNLSTQELPQETRKIDA